MRKLIRDIRPFVPIGIIIRVRVAFQWRPRMFDSTDYNGLHFLLVDEQGSSIHAMIEECYYGHMPMMMEVGKIYDVSKFASKDDTARHKVANHGSILYFTGCTQFKEIKEDLPNFPRYSFNLREYGQLTAEAQNQTTLADLYGCIKSVRAPQVVAVDNPKEKETRTDLTIQLKGREELRISLWADVARLFPVQEIVELPPPVLAVFTGMRISIYEGHVSAFSTPHTCFLINPDIKEKKEYEAEFSKNGDKMKVFGAFSSLMSTGLINEADKRTVSQLKELNPNLHTSKSVYCSAVVKRFFLERGWFYRCCPAEKCFKHMVKKEGPDQPYICVVHGEKEPKLNCRVFMIIEDDHDQTNVTVMGKAAEEFFGATCEQLLEQTPYAAEITLPTLISSKIGHRFMFEIRIGQRGDLFVRSSRESESDVQRIDGSSSGNKKVLETIEAQEPTLQTPDKIIYGRKREHQPVARQLFGSEAEKKSKRDEHAGTSSAKSAAEKLAPDLEKKLK